MTSVDTRGKPGSELLTWLGALRELSSVSTSATDLRHVLNLVADTARSLLGFDFVGVLTPDSAGEKLLITGWSGLSPEYVARVNSDRPIGLGSGSPSSRAFGGGRPVALRDITAEPDFGPWGGVAGEQGYRAIVSVPLVAGAEILGTLNGYYKPVHTFTDFEIERLSLLANHAAIAVTSANRLDELSRLNDSLRDQRDVLTRSEQIHERLLAVTLRSGGLSGIAAVLAELIARPVLIDDTSNTVLAVAGDRAELPDTAWRAGAILDAQTASAPALVASAVDDGTRFYVSLARLDDDAAARIWFARSESALDRIGARAVEHASIVISLELLRMRTAAEVEHRLRGELLADLLAGGPVPSEQLTQRAQRLGHDLTRPHVAIVGALTAGGDPVDDTRLYQRALHTVSELVAGHRPRPLVAMHRGNIVTMWPVDDNRADGDHAAMMQEAMATGSAVRATVAVSPRDATTSGGAYRTAKGALDIAIRAGRTNTVVRLEDLGVLGLLLQLDDSAQLVAFADRALGPLLAYDAAHHTDLIGTLRTYLDHRLDRGATAGALHVHPNTVTQRLRRIESLCGVDLADPAAAVHFSAALTVQQVAES